MNATMWRVKDYVRRFVEEGRVRELIWFLLASFGIASVQWSLTPQTVPLLFSFRISDGMYFAVSFALALLWLGVVIAGFIKCGWAGLLMLIPVK
jgi:hypothetical protein